MAKFQAFCFVLFSAIFLSGLLFTAWMNMTAGHFQISNCGCDVAYVDFETSDVRASCPLRSGVCKTVGLENPLDTLLLTLAKLDYNR